MEPTPRHFREYLELYKATLRGDWPAAERIFNSDEQALTAQITYQCDLPVHVAAGTGRHMPFLRNLVEKMRETGRETGLGILNSRGMTALHVASYTGNTEAARILLSSHPTLIRSRTLDGRTPLHCAAFYRHEETVRFLLEETETWDPPALQGEDGVNLVNLLLHADLYDIAHRVLEKYPNLYLERDIIESTALLKLPTRPQAFLHGTLPGCYRRLALRFLDPETGRTELMHKHAIERYLIRLMLWIFEAEMERTELMYKHAIEIVRRICDETTRRIDCTPERFLRSPMLRAVELGSHEIVTMIIEAYPHALLLCDDHGHSIIHLAILHRQEEIFNLWNQMSVQMSHVIQSRDAKGDNILHLAGKLASSKGISNEALQMQRELQWFKKVEKIVPTLFSEEKNLEGKTPRMVFTEEHRELVKKGEEWMKAAASSCSFVAALVTTVVFASAFTVPGGNNSDKGIPIFLKDSAFMVFAISDAVALFLSCTSLVSFLAILTSHFEEEDFLHSLPSLLSIGLPTLICAIISMVIAFGAALYIVLSHRSKYFLIFIVLLAVHPVTILFQSQIHLLDALIPLLDVLAASYGVLASVVFKTMRLRNVVRD